MMARVRGLQPPQKETFVHLLLEGLIKIFLNILNLILMYLGSVGKNGFAFNSFHSIKKIPELI